MVVLESMKMEHVVGAPAPGTVVSLAVAPGVPVAAGTPLAVIEAAVVPVRSPRRRGRPTSRSSAPTWPRLFDRQAKVLDSGRPRRWRVVTPG